MGFHAADLMTEEQNHVTPAKKRNVGIQQHPRHPMPPSRVSRVFRNILIGVGIALVLIIIGSAVLFLNPFHVLGGGTPAGISSLLSVLARTPLLLLVPLLTLIAVCVVVQVVDRPLALFAYLRAVQKEQERYAKTYIPISADPNSDNLEESVSLLDLVQQQDAHQLVLGAPGAGKTMLLRVYQYNLAQQRRVLVRQRQRIPVFVPLADYSLFLARYGADASQVTILDFLYDSTLAEMHHLRSFLRRLAAQGRLLFLCDGLNEVDSDYLGTVMAELAHLMRADKNRVVITCREVDYQRSPQLEQMLDDGLSEQVVIYALEEKQKRHFVERYIRDQAVDNQRQQHTAGQIMEVIKQTRLRYICGNPMMLSVALDLIDNLGVERTRRIDVRGRLLREFVAQLIRREQRQPKWTKASPTNDEVLLFLSEMACAAWWAHQQYGISLCAEEADKSAVGAINRPLHSNASGWVDGMQHWLDEHPALVPFVVSGESSTIGLHEPYSREKLAQLLEFALGTTLIDIAPGGVLSFRHELIVEYLAAEYFFTSAGRMEAPRVGVSRAGASRAGASPAPTIYEELLADAAYWSGSVILWVGLTADPLQLAERFVNSAAISPDYRLEALALGLLCLSVTERSTQAGTSEQVSLPKSIEKAVVGVLRSPEEREKLARIFTRCAEEGGEEAYHALFSLLLVDGIEEFLVLTSSVNRLSTNPRSTTYDVGGLLFGYLVENADDEARDVQVKRLMRILGRFGGAAVGRASELSSPAPRRSMRLRTAAINILGNTQEQLAVEPLIACLSDANPYIVERAVSALYRLGPERTLPRLLRATARVAPTIYGPSPGMQQMQLAVLRVLERFLDEQSVEQQLTPVQHQRVLEALLPVLTSNYAPEAQQKVRDILARQGHTAGERETGEKAIDLLIRNLSSPDETMVRNAVQTLEKIGVKAVPRLLVQVNSQPSEIVRARMVDVLGHVRDVRALPELLRLLTDPARIIQQQVAGALRNYAPESIPGLIDLVLRGVNEAVAHRAEQVLIEIGPEVVESVLQALHPIVPDRTVLLVHVLEQVWSQGDRKGSPLLYTSQGDRKGSPLLYTSPQSVPALIRLLYSAQNDQTLSIAVVHTLGQFSDARVVLPLLDTLASPHALVYESAINALSNLGDVAVGELIAALDVERKTAVTARVQRALLGMVDFPGQQLLEALAGGSDAQAQNIMEVFLAKGADAAPLLVAHLFDPNIRLQEYVRQILDRMAGQTIVPALLEVLDHPNPEWRELIAEYLLKHPQEALPPLVSLLSEYERAEAAEDVLIQFGPTVLPYIVPGLDAQSNMGQKRAQHILVVLVRQRPDMLSRVMQLFTSSLPERAHEALIDIFINDLVDISVPVLLEGLEDAHLVGDASEALMMLVRRQDARSEEVLQALLASLRVDERRHGAEIALVELGELAVHPVGNLITDPDRAVALAAQNILVEIGAPAFSFIWAAHSDMSNRVRRDAARNIFRSMPASVITDELVELLTSNEFENISMALSLLLERIHDESIQAHAEHEMIPALLVHVQTHGGERASLRIIALLLLLGGGAVIDHLTQALFDYPDHQQRLLYAFLLLGSEAEKMLLDVFRDTNTPPLLRAEVAGILGMLRGEQEEVVEVATTLGEYGLWAGRTMSRTNVLQPARLAVSLRALGGLLMSGDWDVDRLQELQRSTKEGSAARELYDILLGWRYTPRIMALEDELQAERDERERLMKEFKKELLLRMAHIQELEHDLDQVRAEHEARVEELQQATQERQSLRENLRGATQEQRRLEEELQELVVERNRLQAQNEQWREYCARLERELDQLRGNA